ncbi:acyl-CoA dehydrogenase, partial [Nocardioides sp. SOB72]|nr:acyl-CoA dehydrogenase [Nocardioides abyssi]
AHLYLRRAVALRSLVGSTDEAARRLTARAVAGTRRRREVDREGRDAAVRDEVRATVEQVAARPEEERRAGLVDTGYLMPH